MTYYDTETTRVDTQAMHDLAAQSQANPQPAVRVLDIARARPVSPAR